jgi:hypothetical protein
VFCTHVVTLFEQLSVPCAQAPRRPVVQEPDTGFEPTQTPAVQVSVCVQALPSLQAVPLAAFGVEQAPVSVLHVPAVWHASIGAHTTGFEPTQTPLVHVSVCVQPLPSLHAVPFTAFGFEQKPVDGLQTPAAWHLSSGLQTTGLPVHVPFWQLSPVVQRLPSLHAVPFATFGFEQTPVDGSQVPTV